MEVMPFQGYRFNAEVTGDAGACIAPPYDVIDGSQQEALYRRNPYNIVRIDWGKKNPEDNETNNVYTRAAAHLKDFLRAHALQEDARPAFYVYAQDFTVGKATYRRSGFIGLGRLEEYGGKIKPHEQTLAGPKADRLNLTRAIKTQIGQIFMLYSDPQKTVDGLLAAAAKGPELLRFTDEDGVTHRLFAITEEKDLAAIQKVMADKHVFIADGHHRYETALNYYNETKHPKAKYQMMTFVNTHNEGLIILPTHRLIHHIADFSPASLLSKMAEHFDVARLSYSDMLQKKEKFMTMNEALKVEFETGQHAFGMYFNDGAFYVATLRDAAVMEPIAPKQSEAWRQLDVAILHKLIMERMLGIGEEALKHESNVEYIKDFGQATLLALDKVDRGEAQGLFFLNPTRAAEVEAVAMAGEKMPQKSTFFFPKIYSGLVLNVLEK